MTVDRLLPTDEAAELVSLVREIATDCDRDALLIQVEALGPGVCHNGYESCFYRRLEDGQWRDRDQRTFDPASVYGGKP